MVISLRFTLGLIAIWAIWCNGNTPEKMWNRGADISAKACNVSETVQDRTNYYMAD